MEAHVFEGFFKNGLFFDNSNKVIEIPEMQKVQVTLFNEKIKNAPFSDFFGCMKGKIWMADDFDAPLEEMREYME